MKIASSQHNFCSFVIPFYNCQEEHSCLVFRSNNWSVYSFVANGATIQGLLFTQQARQPLARQIVAPALCQQRPTSHHHHHHRWYTALPSQVQSRKGHGTRRGSRWGVYEMVDFANETRMELCDSSILRSWSPMRASIASATLPIWRRAIFLSFLEKKITSIHMHFHTPANKPRKK